MAIDYRQTGTDYRNTNYTYAGIPAHLTAAITGTATTVTAVIQTNTMQAAISATATVTVAFTFASFTGTATVATAIVREIPTTAAVTSTATLNQPVIVRKGSEPELALTGGLQATYDKGDRVRVTASFKAAGVLTNTASTATQRKPDGSDTGLLIRSHTDLGVYYTDVGLDQVGTHTVRVSSDDIVVAAEMLEFLVTKSIFDHS